MMTSFVIVETPRKTRFAINPSTVSAVRGNEDGRTCTIFLTGGRENIEALGELNALTARLSEASA